MFAIEITFRIQMYLSHIIKTDSFHGLREYTKIEVEEMINFAKMSNDVLHAQGLK